MEGMKDMEIVRLENGWIITEGMSRDPGRRSRAWVCNTPEVLQETVMNLLAPGWTPGKPTFVPGIDQKEIEKDTKGTKQGPEFAQTPTCHASVLESKKPSQTRSYFSTPLNDEPQLKK